MNRWTGLIALFMLCMFMVMGCSGGGGNPVAPDTGNNQILTGNQARVVEKNTNKQLWGFYDVVIDTQAGTVEITPNRTVAGIINAVNFYNNNPTNLSTANLVITVKAGEYVDADIDVLLKHPFSGFPKFNGFDFHMALITDGSGTLQYNSPKLTYGVSGTDVTMMDDPVNGDGGGPDGYTRWFNPTEFPTPSLTGYVPGKIATTGYTGDATLNPYKLYADGINDSEPGYDFIAGEGGPGNNVFASGNTAVTRNMYLRFPFGTIPLIRFNYALIASWDGKLFPDPVNSHEVMAADVTVTPDLYYVDPGNKGGSLILDISLAGYGYQPSTIIVESTVFTGAYTLNSTEMTPTGLGGPTYSTYHVEIPSDSALTSTGGNEFWAIAEYNGPDKTKSGYQTFGTTNGAGDDPLAAFFHYPYLEVSNEPGCGPNVDIFTTQQYDPAYDISANPLAIVADGLDTVNPGMDDDDHTGPIPIGFTFTYFGYPFDYVNIGSNGWIVPMLATDPYALSTDYGYAKHYAYNGEACPAEAGIVAFGEDLDQDNGLYGDCLYLLQGTAPNRTFTVMYNNYAFFNGSPTAPRITFSTTLFETGNKVLFQYKDFNLPTTEDPQCYLKWNRLGFAPTQHTLYCDLADWPEEACMESIGIIATTPLVSHDPNIPPVILSGVSGNPTPYAASTASQYYVIANDPDTWPNPALTYTWNVTNTVPGTVPVPPSSITDNGANIQINWSTAGAVNGYEYDIACNVYDGQATVAATTFHVVITPWSPILFQWTGNGNIPSNAWPLTLNYGTASTTYMYCPSAGPWGYAGYMSEEGCGTYLNSINSYMGSTAFDTSVTQAPYIHIVIDMVWSHLGQASTLDEYAFGYFNGATWNEVWRDYGNDAGGVFSQIVATPYLQNISSCRVGWWHESSTTLVDDGLRLEYIKVYWVDNLAPIIQSGVSGPTNPGINETSVYTVTATDDGVPNPTLTYTWNVVDTTSAFNYTSQITGQGTSSISIDWDTMVPAPAAWDAFTISCNVSDGGPPVAATPLAVIVTSPKVTLFYWDGVTNGPGTVTATCGTNNLWAYVPSLQAWDENGTNAINTGQYYICGNIVTAPFTIPAGKVAHVAIKHWGDTEGSWDAGSIGYTINGGTSYVWHVPGYNVWSLYSGFNFNSTGTYYITSVRCCDMSTATAGWENRQFRNGTAWGDQANPVSSDFTAVDPAILPVGSDLSGVQFAFNFGSDGSVVNLGWSIREIIVYYFQ